MLTRISLKIEPGERVGLVAPSGYGKTTLCRLLAGYERPEEGTVEIDSIPIENIRGCMPVQLIWRTRSRRSTHAGGCARFSVRAVRWMRRAGDVLASGKNGWIGFHRSFPAANCSGSVLPERWRQIRGIWLADEITAMFDAVTQSQIWQALLHEAKERELGMVIVSLGISLKRICTRRIDLKALQEKMAAV